MNAEEELKRIGIDEFNRNNYLKNKTLTDNILQVIKEVSVISIVSQMGIPFNRLTLCFLFV
jgi:hypothetical protein